MFIPFFKERKRVPTTLVKRFISDIENPYDNLNGMYNFNETFKNDSSNYSTGPFYETENFKPNETYLENSYDSFDEMYKFNETFKIESSNYSTDPFYETDNFRPNETYIENPYNNFNEMYKFNETFQNNETDPFNTVSFDETNLPVETANINDDVILSNENDLLDIYNEIGNNSFHHSAKHDVYTLNLKPEEPFSTSR